MQTGHILRVFIASPSDVAEERQKTIDSLNRVNATYLASKKPIAIQPVMWETHASAGMGADGQTFINPLVDDCDLLIAIFWTKLGTRTPRAKSGTIEEISRFITKRGGERVLLFFCDRPNPAPPRVLDTKATKGLQTFAQKMKGEGLYVAFASVEDFAAKLQHQLGLKLGPLVHNLSRGRLSRMAETEDRIVSKERLALASGQWRGTSTQDVLPERTSRRANVQMQISVDGTRISGSADLRLTIDGRKAQLVFMLDGRFQNDRFLRLDYTSSVAGETHFGTFILEMNPLGTRLTGQFLGYGAYTERLVWGKLTVEKQRIVAENVKRERA